MKDPLFGTVSTALGAAGVAVTAHGITRATLFLASEDGAAAALREAGASPGSTPLLEEALAALSEYSGGRVEALDALPIDLRTGTPLQRAVWLALRSIPAGETRTYSWLARTLGLGRGRARAVGAALARNPIPIWLPCHRVVGADGSLRGFAGGLEMKRRLLTLEGAYPPRLPLG